MLLLGKNGEGKGKCVFFRKYVKKRGFDAVELLEEDEQPHSSVVVDV